MSSSDKVFAQIMHEWIDFLDIAKVALQNNLLLEIGTLSAKVTFYNINFQNLILIHFQVFYCVEVGYITCSPVGDH